MSQKNEPSFETLKNDSARQRWELFHRAIATAKRSNTSAMQEADHAGAADGTEAESDDKSGRTEPQLSVAR
jgi:hypothetical protein